MSVFVRPFEERDREAVRHICVATATIDLAPEVLTLRFCDYYIDCEPQGAFVLDSDGVAVGYIVSARNCTEHKKQYHSRYLQKLKQLDRNSWRNQKLEEFWLSLCGIWYPAHLHIDILPEYTAKKYGWLLMDALMQYLRQKKVRGVMLGCGEDNASAHKFYERYGFQLFAKPMGSRTYVMRLKD